MIQMKEAFYRCEYYADTTRIAAHRRSHSYFSDADDARCGRTPTPARGELRAQKVISWQAISEARRALTRSAKSIFDIVTSIITDFAAAPSHDDTTEHYSRCGPY